MSEPLTFVSWRWRNPVTGTCAFAPETVYALREMVQRFYQPPHRFVCVTDRPEELKGVETIRIWEDCAGIPAPLGRSYPSCWRRLKIFAPGMEKVFGPRLVSIDLDTVIVNDIEPLFDRPENLVLWGESDYPGKQWCNGSLQMLRTGTMPHIWTQFDPEKSPALVERSTSKGSDQGWINYVMGPNLATWGRKDGVYSFRKHIAPKDGNALPADARIVFFHGKEVWKPWSYKCQHFTWIREKYPLQVPA